MWSQIRLTTGIHENVLNFGTGQGQRNSGTAAYSHMEEEMRQAA
jgi:hypothetical protein